MAKQTFTTGQVLTAAQMTSLQQTAMGGGSATAKTTSYVLVAADAGGTVAMNAAGATTITVNTGLFAAGDTVFIQNLGAGNCTVTAGTATVASAGSLILPQYDAGILYFTATGAAIFYDYIQAGGASPLTTKGDLYTYSTSDARLAVGTNNYVLTADSAEATGLKWAAAGGASGLTLVKTQAIGSTPVSSITVTSAFSATYDNYLITVNGGVASTNNNLGLQLGSITTGYYGFGFYGNASASTLNGDNVNNGANFSYAAQGDTNILSGQVYLQNPNLAKVTMAYTAATRSGTNGMSNLFGSETSTTQHTAFTLVVSSGTVTGGTIRVYGYSNS